MGYGEGSMLSMPGKAFARVLGYSPEFNLHSTSTNVSIVQDSQQEGQLLWQLVELHRTFCRQSNVANFDKKMVFDSVNL